LINHPDNFGKNQLTNGQITIVRLIFDLSKDSISNYNGGLYYRVKEARLLWVISIYIFFATERVNVSDRFFFCFPKRKSSKKKRGNLNMLPCAHSGARPRLSWASARLTLEIRLMVNSDQWADFK
jgi:hypothetical protein